MTALTLDLPRAAAPVPAPSPNKPSLAGLDRAGLIAAMASIGVPEAERKMRADQMHHWLYVRGAKAFDSITNVSKHLRAALAEVYTLDRPEIVAEQVSADGTRKWLMRMPSTGPHDRGAEIETVYIPEESRGTLCVSSQVGCTLTCTFCHTGTQKLVRNLTTAEVVAQLLVARDRLGDWPGETPPEGAIVPRDGGRFVSNVVMMGMGEPLYNYDNVIAALKVMTDPDGLCLSRRRVTLSTSGVVPMIGPLGDDLAPALAISLHAVRDDLRDTLVPINRKYPIAQLLDACRNYAGLSNARRITFEYVMLKGVNDSLDDARRLVRLLKGIPAKINLIPFNPWPGTVYECSDWGQIEAFSEVVFRAGYASPIRTPRGRDILAACGQLKSESLKMRAKDRIAIEAEAMKKLAVEAYYIHGADDALMRFIVRLLIVPIGIGFAALAALVCGVAGAVASGLMGNFTSLLTFSGLTVLIAAITGADPEDIGTFLLLLWLVALGVLFIPIILMALIGEIFGIASWMAYAFGMGAIFALTPILFPGDPTTHGWPAGTTLGFFATGIIAGTVYWLIAGHGAGRKTVAGQALADRPQPPIGPR